MRNRRLTSEIMDDPAVDRTQLDRALGFIRGVNKRLGGTKALIEHLDCWSSDWPKNTPISLLDIGTGSADLPLEARRWAMSRGFDLRITALDLHATTLELAGDHINQEPELAEGIDLVLGDALKLTDTFGPGSFDYVHAGMFLHHLKEVQILTVLRMMDRIARRGIIWNDLIRSRRGAVVINLMTLGREEIIRHDARVSVDAGFTKSEVLNFAKRVDLGYCDYRWSLLANRFTLAGQRHNAWEQG